MASHPEDDDNDNDDPGIFEDPLLHRVCSLIRGFGPLDTIRSLLAEGVDVNEQVSHGRRLLHFAVYHRHVDAMRLLLVRGADPSVMDDKGYSPVHVAAEIGFCNVLRLLLDYHARVDFSKVLSGDVGYSFPQRASPAEEPLRLALKSCNYRAAELLLKHGANPNARYPSGSEINFLYPADAKGAGLLLKYGADPNARDSQGISLLMQACRNPEGHDVAQLLIAAGADVNATTEEEQRTPLHCAALSGNLAIVKLLVGAGARVSLPPDYAKPPPLFFAMLRSDFLMMRYLLQLGADVNRGSAVVGSALHVALTELGASKYSVVKFLLEQGADPNAILTSGSRTVLKPPLGEYLAAVSEPEPRLIRLCLRYGARILLVGQRQHPLGILQALHHVDVRCPEGEESLRLLSEAAEAFCVSLIDHSVLMSQRHKLVLLQRALCPSSLAHCARVRIRRLVGWGPRWLDAVQDMDLPRELKSYLLFED